MLLLPRNAYQTPCWKRVGHVWAGWQNDGVGVGGGGEERARKTACPKASLFLVAGHFLLSFRLHVTWQKLTNELRDLNKAVNFPVVNKLFLERLVAPKKALKKVSKLAETAANDKRRFCSFRFLVQYGNLEKPWGHLRAARKQYSSNRGRTVDVRWIRSAINSNRKNIFQLNP